MPRFEQFDSKKEKKEENREEDRLVTHLGFLQAIQGSESLRGDLFKTIAIK
jgi:hypothetical protein